MLLGCHVGYLVVTWFIWLSCDDMMHPPRSVCAGSVCRQAGSTTYTMPGVYVHCTPIIFLINLYWAFATCVTKVTNEDELRRHVISRQPIREHDEMSRALPSISFSRTLLDQEIPDSVTWQEVCHVTANRTFHWASTVLHCKHWAIFRIKRWPS